MYSGRIVFSQLMNFLPKHEFAKCVQRYRGNYWVKKFPCLSQFLYMAFAQLTYRESLRDIETCLRALQPKGEQKAKETISNIPLNRIGLPEDIGMAVVFLCSEKASYITGEILRVNGGSAM